MKTITIESSSENIIENVEEQPKRKVLKSKRPNRGRNAKVVEQQEQEEKSHLQQEQDISHHSPQKSS